MPMDSNKPHFVSSAFKKDEEYIHWLQKVKEQYRSSQAKAAVRVNDAMIEFYWKLGHDIVDLKAESKWGTGVIEQLSLDMREEFPDVRGFSTRNLWYVKQWYILYSQHFIKLQQVVAELDKQGKLSQVVGEMSRTLKVQQPVAVLQYPQIFSLVPWSHHIMIVSKCKDIDEAIFYLLKDIEGHWSRSVLEDFIAEDLYQAQGSLPFNFDTTLPEDYSAKVKEVLKDPYDFGFLKLPRKYQERDLEDALTHNITRFLLELGKGFTFYGRQVELVVSGTSYFLDMLFYHVRLKCYVVVELKVTDFKPEYVGKLNFYVTAVDRLLKQDDDKPTIGLLICKSKDNTKVEWSFDGLNKPIGVAAYDLKRFLPTSEEMESQIRLMMEEQDKGGKE
jgi:predicted nuclease of restriction endonuclease-like (RecB) superfamily